MAEVAWFEDIVGQDLSGVTFVRDYVQLQFNPPPILNIYTPITVRCGPSSAISGHPDFANALIAQINKYVDLVSIEPGAAIVLHFADQSAISFSTKADDVGAYEAFTLFPRTGGVYEE